MGWGELRAAGRAPALGSERDLEHAGVRYRAWIVCALSRFTSTTMASSEQAALD